MRRYGKPDANQSQIVEALRGIPECSVVLLSSVGNGCPDVLVGFRGFNFLVEIKNPETKHGEKPETIKRQADFKAAWRGQHLRAYSLTEIVSFMTGFQFSEPSRDGTTEPVMVASVRSPG